MHMDKSTEIQNFKNEIVPQLVWFVSCKEHSLRNVKVDHIFLHLFLFHFKENFKKLLKLITKRKQVLFNNEAFFASVHMFYIKCRKQKNLDYFYVKRDSVNQN